MAKGQHLSGHQQKIVKNYYQNLDTAMLQKLGEIVSDLYLSADEPGKVARLWQSANKALQNLKAEPGRVSSIVARRNVEELALFIGELNMAGKAKPSAPARPTETQTKAAPPPPATPAPQSPDATDVPSPTDRATIKRAMKAFRKRLKLTRLDEESSLGYGPMTGGRKSSVAAIQPPNQYPPEVWAELVKQGRLKDAGQGFYQLVEE